MNKTKGFTLIEVLIAAVILFMTIAVTTLVYRSALLSTRKAEQSILSSGYLPMIVDDISEVIKQKDTGTETVISGDGITMQIQYDWQASLLQAKSAPSTLDSFTGAVIKQPPRYRLWQVTLDIKTGTNTKQFVYEDLSYPEIQ